MHAYQIPVKLTLAEVCAAALLNAADELTAAADLSEFVTALNANHRLWQILVEMAPLNRWTFPVLRDADYAITKSRKLGTGVDDDDIEVLVEINQRAARDFAPMADGFGVLNRARLACTEAQAQRLGQWLLSQIERRSHYALVAVHH